LKILGQKIKKSKKKKSAYLVDQKNDFFAGLNISGRWS